MSRKLNALEQQQLLKIARKAILNSTKGDPLETINFSSYSSELTDQGASFVTLTEVRNGNLRGCIGTLEAYQPLILDVQKHAVEAALEDYRFPPVSFEEVESLKIEISRLSVPVELDYEKPQELIKLLRPGVDGVVIRDGKMRATFLPQVWEKVPNVEDFLAHLCIKMGAPANLWQRKKIQVLIYQVEEFQE
jgi:AmmeMemoRadiSam system protein A